MLLSYTLNLGDTGPLVPGDRGGSHYKVVLAFSDDAADALVIGPIGAGVREAPEDWTDDDGDFPGGGDTGFAVVAGGVLSMEVGPGEIIYGSGSAGTVQVLISGIDNPDPAGYPSMNFA